MVLGQKYRDSSSRLISTNSASRPICARCVALRTECVYEAQQGESRWAALRRTSDGLESQRDELREIVAYLRSQPESEALEVFHRLRNQGQNDSLTAILQWIRARGTSAQAFGGPDGSTSRTQQLPPLRTMVNMQNMQPSHAARGSNHDMRSQSLTSDGSGSSRSYESSASGEDGTAVQSGAA